jgi:hypothetical protein
VVGEGDVGGALAPQRLDGALDVVVDRLGDLEVEGQVAALGEVAEAGGLGLGDLAGGQPAVDLAAGVGAVDPQVAGQQAPGGQRPGRRRVGGRGPPLA